MSEDTASRGGAMVPLRWFQIVLFLVAVPPPFPFHFADISLFRALMFPLPLAVLGVIVFKSVRWKKFPQAVAHLHNPWIIMTLMLATGPGIMQAMSTLFLMCFLHAPHLYHLPLLMALCFIIFMALRRQGRRPGDMVSWPQNPWLRILLVITGLPAAAAYLAGGFFTLPFILFDLAGLPLTFRLCLAGLIMYAVLIVYVFCCFIRKARHEDGWGRRNAWLFLLVRIVGFGLLATATLVLGIASLTADKSMQAWLSPLWGGLPMLLAAFSVYKAMIWKMSQQEVGSSCPHDKTKVLP